MPVIHVRGGAVDRPRATETLTQLARAVAAAAPCDVDVMDPANAPGTGTPEAGGITSRELLATLRALAGIDLVGADVVEVAPAYDHAEITGIAAAHVTYELLSAMARGRKGYSG